MVSYSSKFKSQILNYSFNVWNFNRDVNIVFDALKRSEDSVKILSLIRFDDAFRILNMVDSKLIFCV